MKLNFMGRAKQAGFTLIELIVVIVILGIMAATALPKFMDLGADARLAKAQAGMAAVKAGMAMAHGTMQAKGLSGNATVTLGGKDYILGDGYPTALNIMEIAGVDTDYKNIPEPTTDDPATVVVATDTDHPNCGFIYTEATSTTPAAITLAGNSLVLADCE
jgi:MSHA pilin protein MshA